jgi:dihydrofolate synthase/folylpolyglutamate synthase
MFRCCRAFAAVEQARGDVSLTYFEFGTLAAMWHFQQCGVDVAILEVGLGGRLDAVNVFEPDCAAVVTVDLDHQEYLGNDRETIGREKAGVFRAGKPAICGDAHPPASLLSHAEAIGAPLLCIGRDFGFQRQELQWSFWGPHGKHLSLPFPGLRGSYQLNNASVALAILAEMRSRLPVSIGDIKRGLLEVDWPGRFQVLPGRPTTIFDVGHNPHAARALAGSLKTMGYHPQTFAVFSMLRDKDLAEVVAAVNDQIDVWLVAGLDLPRGMSAEEVAAQLAAANARGKVLVYPNIAEAYSAACDKAGENDRIVVFGSFHTVAEAMAARRNRGH